MEVKITDAELEVMRVLWRENRPLSFAEIRKELEVTKGWNKSTIQTMLRRLREKGAVSTSTMYVTLFAAALAQADYISAENQSLLDKLFDGSAKKLVAKLYHDGQLGQEDIDELREYFIMGAGRSDKRN